MVLPLNHLLANLQANPNNKPLELSEDRDAIIVSPAYRLLPESTGADIMNDLKRPLGIGPHVPTEIRIWEIAWTGTQLGKHAVFGESAGGYLSLKSAFLFHSTDIIVVMAQYYGSILILQLGGILRLKKMKRQTHI